MRSTLLFRAGLKDCASKKKNDTHDKKDLSIIGIKFGRKLNYYSTMSKNILM